MVNGIQCMFSDAFLVHKPFKNIRSKIETKNKVNLVYAACLCLSQYFLSPFFRNDPATSKIDEILFIFRSLKNLNQTKEGLCSSFYSARPDIKALMDIFVVFSLFDCFYGFSILILSGFCLFAIKLYRHLVVSRIGLQDKHEAQTFQNNQQTNFSCKIFTDR